MKHIKLLAVLLACSTPFTSCAVSYDAYGMTVVAPVIYTPQYYTYRCRPSVYSHYDYAIAREHGRQNRYGRHCHY
jgi:hypothetical protein